MMVTAETRNREQGVVVVAVDFSPGSARALATGRELADRQGWQVCLVHVRRKDTRGWQPARRETAWLEEQGLDTEAVRVRTGEPWVELVKAADELSAAWLVAGTHGESGFQPFRLGTTASQVALRSRSPVVLVSAAPPVTPRGSTKSTYEETP